jgi:hypothetical protein
MISLSTDRGCVGDQPQKRSISNGSWKAVYLFVGLLTAKRLR